MGNQIKYINCLDCDHEGYEDDFEIDYDYDEFWGREYKYYVCPICDGGCEVTIYDEDELNEISND